MTTYQYIECIYDQVKRESFIEGSLFQLYIILIFQKKVKIKLPFVKTNNLCVFLNLTLHCSLCVFLQNSLIHLFFNLL